MKWEFIKPLESKPRTTRCSSFDAMIAYVFTTLVFCYRERLDAERLRHSLARVLSDFGSYAGRLRRDSGALYIDHARGGAAFDVAHSSQRSTELGIAARARPSKSALRPRLSALGVLRGKEPPFAVRLTQTADGSVLAVTWNHALGDHVSAMQLLRAWSLAYNDRAFDAPVEVDDRAAYLRERLPKPRLSEPAWRVLSWREFAQLCYHHLWATRPGRRVVLDFSWSEVARIHAAAAGAQSVTLHDALSAHVFLLIQRISGGDVSPHFAIAVNARKRLALPENLLGNLSDVVTMTANAFDDTARVAAGLRACIRSFGDGAIGQRDHAAFCASHPGLLNALRFWPTTNDPRRTNLALTNVSGLGHFELIFETERPSFVHTQAADFSVAPIGLGTVIKSPQDTGLTVELTLPAKLASRLERSDYREPLAALPLAAE